MPVSFIRQRTAVTYTGPGDIVSGATAWYGLRAYNAAYATGSNNAINVRRASDNSTSDIVILANGNLDIATANTFAGVDATASATATASTTLNLTSASSTPHVGSTITGAGVTQPCYIVSVGSFAGGTGTVVVNAAQTLAAVSISMQYALFVTEAYDQTGNGNHATQATAGTQPQLLPAWLNSLPALRFLPSVLASGAITDTAQPYSFSEVVIRTGGIGADGTYMGSVNPGGTTGALLDSITSNTLFASAGTNLTGTLSDNAWHAFQALFATTGVLNIDGTETSGSVGARSSSTGPLLIGGRSSTTGNLTGGIKEVGYWPLGFSSGNRSALRTNQSAYWGTP